MGEGRIIGVQLESVAPNREVVTVFLSDASERVEYDGPDRAEAHRVKLNAMMQMRSWRGLVAHTPAAEGGE